jgi:hypothetical protein
MRSVTSPCKLNLSLSARKSFILCSAIPNNIFSVWGDHLLLWMYCMNFCKIGTLARRSRWFQRGKYILKCQKRNSDVHLHILGRHVMCHAKKIGTSVKRTISGAMLWLFTRYFIKSSFFLCCYICFFFTITSVKGRPWVFLFFWKWQNYLWWTL